MDSQNRITRIEKTIDTIRKQAFVRRLWDKDFSLWRQGADGVKVIQNRFGWLNIVDVMKERADEIVSFADEVKAAGFTHAVLMGMGGSSLSPEVSSLTFGIQPGYPNLVVLDSTVPATVLEFERYINLPKTLFIVSTKSGTTVETLSAYRYFFEKVATKKGESAGENFVAITDPGTPLEDMAREKNFRRVFLNFPDIGGRYSALSYFGLVPLAIIGADVKRLLDNTTHMVDACKPSTPLEQNSGALLGTIMAEFALEGRDKLMLVLPPEIASFGSWIEQLVAESTGKNGTGIVPVDAEPLAGPLPYRNDRLFVYYRLKSNEHKGLDAQMKALEEFGQPVYRIEMNDIYDLGQEYFRWEFATAVASALLGVNAFDEPNVKESKDNTNYFLGEFKSNGKLPEEKPILQESGIQLYCNDITKKSLDELRHGEPSLKSYLKAHLDQYLPGDYFGLMAFVFPSPTVNSIFACIRAQLRDAFGAATTLGYGPRFLHSTGQLHKGGPNSGIFIQFTADDPVDVAIPGEPYSFSILKQAQAMGDEAALIDKGRPLIRLHLGSDVHGNLNKILDIFREVCTIK